MHLQQTYKKEVVPRLMRELGISNPMAVPRLIKIVVNCGLGEAVTDKKVMDKVSAQLAVITGQKPQQQRARRAIANFKLRAGDPVGLRMTLRGRRMWDFFTRLVTVALPRVRDFHGVPSRSFDAHGNYTLGIREQTIFPELDYQLVDKVRGFEVTFVTSGRSMKEGNALLSHLGMPFEKDLPAGR